MIEEKENIYSLHQLTEYPPVMDHPIYREYPFFKLGVKEGVQYFSERLIPLVEKIMTANPGYKYWALTSPPSRGIPTAANLLAFSIYEHFKRENTKTKYISVVKLYNKSYEGPIDENAGDFSKFSGYSSYSWQERLELMSKNLFVLKEEDFRNRGIIFINDINVTGSSQENFSQIFANVYPGKINWLYIIDCDKTIGRRDPQLEYEINNANIKTVADFAAILASEEIQHTAKCISKIFSYNSTELEQLLKKLDRSQRSRLWDSIQREDIYQGDIFKEKMELIRKVCQ